MTPRFRLSGSTGILYSQQESMPSERSDVPAFGGHPFGAIHETFRNVGARPAGSLKAVNGPLRNLA